MPLPLPRSPGFLAAEGIPPLFLGPMNRPFKSGLLIAVGLTAVLALSSCSMLRQYLPGGHDQSAQSSQSNPDASSSQKNEEYTLQGTLNQIDTDLKYLVLISDDLYFRFDFSESDADLSDLAPGDSITVTYTGPLEPDSEDVTAQLVSVTKDT